MIAFLLKQILFCHINDFLQNKLAKQVAEVVNLQR